MTGWVNILRFKKAARAPLLEEVVGVLEEHRAGGTLFGPAGVFVVCRCGQRFSDRFGQDGTKALRRHVAEHILKLQTSAKTASPSVEAL